jgi:hypothetical protein
MRIWFDTEFLEDGHTIKLISIGMVREDRATFYGETLAAERLAESNDWLAENVRPHLRGESARYGSAALADAVRAFAGESPEFWAYYASYDWVALCQIYGTMMDLPKGWPMYCRDLQQVRDMLGGIELPKQTGAEHDALADAVWTRDAWLWLRDQGKMTWLDAVPETAWRAHA